MNRDYYSHTLNFSQEERVPEHLRGDVMYAPSHHSGGGSTLRITARKTRSPDSGSSSSSGRGSGSRLGSGFDTAQYGSINRFFSRILWLSLSALTSI